MTGEVLSRVEKRAKNPGRGGPIDKEGFTLKERLFIEEIQVDWNATQAAIRSGYSPKNAKHIGSQNLHKPRIVEAITRAMAKRVDRTSISAQWVLTKLVDVEKEAAKVPGGAGRKDRLRALELIGKHVDVNAFRTQFGLSGPNGGPIVHQWDLAVLTDEELDTFERLLGKITAGREADAPSDPGGAGGEDAPAGEGEA